MSQTFYILECRSPLHPRWHPAAGVEPMTSRKTADKQLRYYVGCDVSYREHRWRIVKATGARRTEGSGK